MRGLRKIEEAADEFEFVFDGKTVLDVGSSTGGFTEYALRQGAKEVIAIEKGTNQMKAPLRFDSRIELHEKTDIFEFGFADREALPDVVVADVSFVSLKKVLSRLKTEFLKWQKPGGNEGETRQKSTQKIDFLVMLKPQFEARPEQLNRGVVKNEKMRRAIIKDFEDWLKRDGFLVVKKRDNSLAGKHGNVERFYWLRSAS